MVRRDHRYPVSRLMPRLMRKTGEFYPHFPILTNIESLLNIIPILVRGREGVQKKVRNADSF